MNSKLKARLNENKTGSRFKLQVKKKLKHCFNTLKLNDSYFSLAYFQ